MDIGVIGVGTMGRNHARNYAELKKADALYVTDLNIKAAEEVARANGGKSVLPLTISCTGSMRSVSVSRRSSIMK